MSQSTAEKLHQPDRQRFLPGLNIFERFYPDLPSDLVSHADRLMADILFTIINDDNGCNLIGSLARRIAESNKGWDNPNFERVRRQFSHLSELNPNDKILLELSRGYYDIDMKSTLPSDTLGARLLDNVADYFHQFNVKDILEEEKGNRRYIRGQLNGNLQIEASFGAIPTNNLFKNGTISFIYGEKELFVVHIGTYPKTYDEIIADKRSGELLSKKSGLNLDLRKAGNSIVIDKESIEIAEKIMNEPDDFESDAIGDLPSEVERTLRSIRIAILHHRYIGDQIINSFITSRYISPLFTSRAMVRMGKIFHEAVANFAKPETQPSDTTKLLYMKELIVSAAADPFLFMILAESFHFLNIVPRCGYPCLPRKVLTSDAFSSYTIEMVNSRARLVPLYKRNHQFVLTQWDKWQANPNREKGLRLLYQGLDGHQRSPGDITSDEFYLLISRFDFSDLSPLVYRQGHLLFETPEYPPNLSKIMMIPWLCAQGHLTYVNSTYAPENPDIIFQELQDKDTDVSSNEGRSVINKRLGLIIKARQRGANIPIDVPDESIAFLYDKISQLGFDRVEEIIYNLLRTKYYPTNKALFYFPPPYYMMEQCLKESGY